MPHAAGRRVGDDIAVGQSTFIGPNAWLNVLPGGRLVIGDRTSIAEGLTVSCGGSVEIGSGCLFSARVTIVDQDHDFEAWIGAARSQGGEPAMTWDMGPARPVRVGAGSWVGVNVTILPGVTIGEGCVVGAGSVVTSDLPPFTVAAGVPARPLREIGAS